MVPKTGTKVIFARSRNFSAAQASILFRIATEQWAELRRAMGGAFEIRDFRLPEILHSWWIDFRVPAL
jgi:hypothetical protein